MKKFGLGLSSALSPWCKVGGVYHVILFRTLTSYRVLGRKHGQKGKMKDRDRYTPHDEYEEQQRSILASKPTKGVNCKKNPYVEYEIMMKNNKKEAEKEHGEDGREDQDGNEEQDMEEVFSIKRGRSSFDRIDSVSEKILLERDEHIQRLNEIHIALREGKPLSPVVNELLLDAPADLCGSYEELGFGKGKKKLKNVFLNRIKSGSGKETLTGKYFIL